MRVQQPQALEAAAASALAGQRRDHQALGVAHQDVGYYPLAVQQDTNLAVQVQADFGQLPGQFGGEQAGGRHLAAIKPLQEPVLLGL